MKDRRHRKTNALKDVYSSSTTSRRHLRCCSSKKVVHELHYSRTVVQSEWVCPLQQVVVRVSIFSVSKAGDIASIWPSSSQAINTVQPCCWLLGILISSSTQHIKLISSMHNFTNDRGHRETNALEDISEKKQVYLVIIAPEALTTTPKTIEFLASSTVTETRGSRWSASFYTSRTAVQSEWVCLM